MLGIHPVQLHGILPPALVPQNPVALSIECPPAWTNAFGWVVLASALQRPQPLPAPHFATGSLLQIDFATMFGIIPMPLTGGNGATWIGASGIAPALSGLDLYLQALVFDGQGQYHVSDAYVAVIY